MNREIKPLQALLVISFFVLLILFYTWANNEAVKIAGPGLMFKNENGHLFIRLDKGLLQFDDYGAFIRNINLQSMGVDESIGGLLYTGGGDIILRLGKDNRSFTQNIRSFLRLDNTDSIQVKNIDSGLYRCNMNTSVCNRFTTQNIDFNSVFHLEKDAYDDGVFLADTSRHRIIKFDSRGNEMLVFDKGLKFPNQMKYFNNRLYIANTNYKKIKILNIKREGVEILKDVSVVTETAILEREIFPAVISMVKGQWWIINMQGDMSHGGVYRFDKKWKYLSRLSLPEDAEPGYILDLNNNEVLISDPGNFVIYRFDAAGKRLKDFAPEELVRILAQKKEKRDFYVNLSYVPMGIFVIALIIGVAIAVYAEISDKTESKKSTRSNVQPAITVRLVWISVNKKIFKNLYYMTGGAFILLVMSFFLIYFTMKDLGQSKDLANIFIITCSLIFILPIVLILYLKHIVKARIGVQGGIVFLKDHRGMTTDGHVSDVYYNNRAIVLNNVAVLTGRKPQLFYAEDEMDKYLYPLLEKANRVNHIKMMLLLYKARHPSVYLEAFIIVASVILIVLTQQ